MSLRREKQIEKLFKNKTRAERKSFGRKQFFDLAEQPNIVACTLSFPENLVFNLNKLWSLLQCITSGQNEGNILNMENFSYDGGRGSLSSSSFEKYFLMERCLAPIMSEMSSSRRKRLKYDKSEIRFGGRYNASSYFAA